MTQTQHTPGPWFYDGQNGCGAHVIHVAQGEIAEAFGDSWSDDGQQAEANAHLIAAAPELLAQLSIALRWLEAIPTATACRANPGEGNLEAIRAAIAKAKGGAA
ncbi:MAG: hypothetical protein A2792_01115 [Sphingomonadales bacterium RIFCSPHIGHO2_01_FULL_65_20]|nr:MAG: hypothetical protein A2792_01115 [Sphingomonadales bacterium RIFCSPHIGHO2_01_FULL_65_20]